MKCLKTVDYYRTSSGETEDFYISYYFDVLNSLRHNFLMVSVLKNLFNCYRKFLSIIIFHTEAYYNSPIEAKDFYISFCSGVICERDEFFLLHHIFGMVLVF